MEIKTVKYMLRKNLGNYEHAEITLEAHISEGELAPQAIVEVMSLAKRALEGEITAVGIPSGATISQVDKPATTSKKLVTEKVELKPLGTEPAATANFVKEVSEQQEVPPELPKEAKKQAPRRAAKAPVEAAQAETPSEDSAGTSSVVGKVDRENVTHVQSSESKASTPVSKVDKGTVLYDKTVKEHRSRFATYLGTNHKGWQNKKNPDEIRDFSANLHGKPFEDAKGNMLESFKAELKAFFG